MNDVCVRWLLAYCCITPIILMTGCIALDNGYSWGKAIMVFGGINMVIVIPCLLVLLAQAIADGVYGEE